MPTTELTARVRGAARRWPPSATTFCVIYMFFLGLAFVLDTWLPIVPRESTWGAWGHLGLTVIGAVFVLLAGYGYLYPERGAAVVATFVLAGIGIVTATLVNFSAVALIFWLLAIVGAVVEAAERVERTGHP